MSVENIDQFPPPIPTDPEKFVDPLDVIRSYDEELYWLLTIQTPSKNLSRVYKKDELEEMLFENLEIIAQKLEVDISPQRLVLIRNILNGQRIPVVFASPSPLFSEQKDTTGRTEPTTVNTIRYPIVSLQRLSIVDDQSRYSRPVRRTIAWTDDSNAVLQAWQPNPVLLTYQVEFISTKQSHMNLMDMWVQRLFSFPEVRFLVDHGKPWGKIPVYMAKEAAYSDTTQYETTPEEALKIFRHIYTFVVKGWMPTEAWFKPTVRTFVESYEDESSKSGEPLLEIKEVLENIYE